MTGAARGARLVAPLLVVAALAGCAQEKDPGLAPGPADVDVDTAALRELRRDADIAPCVAGADDPAEGGLPAVTLPCLGGGDDVHLAALRGPMVVNLWASWCGPCRAEMPILQDFAERYDGRVSVLGIDYEDVQPQAALKLARESGVTYPLLADPQAELSGAEPFPALRGLPFLALVDADGVVVHQEFVALRSRQELERLVEEHLGGGHVIPTWLEPVRDATSSITVDDLTSFLPPADIVPRRGAVLMLFGEGPDGPDLLLTERAHHMRSHPAQVSFPGGSVDAGETAIQAALREGQEETGLQPDGVEVFAVLPELWLPPSNFAVTPVIAWWSRPSEVSVVDPDEVHAVYRTPLSELLDPEHRMSVRHPSGWVGPGFLIGDDKDVILWGFTAGILSRLFDFVGWTRAWDATRMRDLPEHMLPGLPDREQTTLPGDPREVR